MLNEVNKKTEKLEFYKIKEILRKEFRNEMFKLVDIGSGLCNFSNFVKNEFQNAQIHCLDINEDLVNLAIKFGHKAQKGDITKLPYDDNSFDVVHCSHVIEHLSYPQVVKAIDELVRIAKNEGLIIIRSSLWANHRFYNDIDHIRPYPPNAIINYFKNPQQQKVSKYLITEEYRWYTSIYYEIDPTRFTYKFIKYINVLLKLSWLFFNLPTDRPNNYGLVLRKKIN